MSRRKISTVWLHFEEQDYQRAKCKHCKATISFTERSRGNLNRHLKSKHPLKFSGSEKHLPKSKIIPVKQITKCVHRPYTYDKEEIDRQLLKMIAKSHHSLRLVEEPEFRKLILEVSNCPGYTPPAWKVLINSSKSYIDMEMLDGIKSKMQSTTAVCLSTDEWTSTTNISYVSVTAHYINSETMLTSHLLTCGEFESKETPENLCTFLQKVLLDFEINNKVIAIVSDNSSNISEAISLGEWQGIGCFIHTLNSIAQVATAEIADTLDKVKKIVEYFNKRVHVLKELQTYEKHTCLPTLKFKQDTSPGWNSTFQMLQNVFQEKYTVITTLSLNCPELLLDIEDWEIIEDAISVIMPFNEVIEEISEENVTVSKVIVLCNLLQSYDFKCISANKNISNMINILESTLSSSLGNLESETLFAESIILDPRFKRKGFRNDFVYEQALKVLRSKICNVRLPEDEELTTSTYNSSVADPKSIWYAFDLDLNMTEKIDNHGAGLELDKYISEEYLERNKDPLLWWKERKNTYPRVYMFALKRLCIVATTIQ